jgi:zinc transport system substrate-binding protein
MKKILILLAGLFVIMLVVTTAYFVRNESQESLEGLKVAATIFPLTDIARNIGGDKIDVVNMVPPGASPHTFEVTSGQVKNLQGTRIIFSIGYDLDDWIVGIQDILPDAEIENVSKGVELRSFEESGEAGPGSAGEEEHEHHEDGEEDEEEDHRHEHGEIDPHYWLSVKNAKIIAINISEQLQELDPENSEYYQANTVDYIRKLNELDIQTEDLFSDISSNKIMTMHNAWSYFAKDYGLEVVATFEPFPGREPTAKYLVDLSKEAKEHSLTTIFSEPQLSNQVLIPFLQDMDMNLSVLDPIGGLEERDTYIKLMQYNSEVIHEELK